VAGECLPTVMTDTAQQWESAACTGHKATNDERFLSQWQCRSDWNRPQQIAPPFSKRGASLTSHGNAPFARFMSVKADFAKADPMRCGACVRITSRLRGMHVMDLFCRSSGLPATGHTACAMPLLSDLGRLFS
jgi:hypothetical protein